MSKLIGVCAALCLLAGCATENKLVRSFAAGSGGVGYFLGGDVYTLAGAGAASAGLFQVSEQGTVLLTEDLGVTDDTIRVVNGPEGIDYKGPISEPLPAETEATVRLCWSAEMVDAFGLTWE